MSNTGHLSTEETRSHLSTEETERLTDLPTPARALAIGAHPDDVEFGCGATLAKWAEAGAEVRLLVLTDGSKGTWDPAADLGTLVATRRREQDASAAVRFPSESIRASFVPFPNISANPSPPGSSIWKCWRASSAASSRNR